MKRRTPSFLGMAALLAALSLTTAASAWAEQRPTPSDLPSAEQARRGIDEDPAVVEARGAPLRVDHPAGCAAPPL